MLPDFTIIFTVFLISFFHIHKIIGHCEIGLVKS